MATTGCGPSCGDVARRMEVATARTPPADGAHLELALPLSELNPLVAELVAELEPRTRLPGVNLPILPEVPGPDVRVTAVELVPFSKDKIGARIELELSSLGVQWLRSEVTIGVRAVVRGNRVELRLNPADIVSARVRLPTSALTEAIERTAGRLVKALPRSKAAKVIELVARSVELHGGRIIRDELLRPLGEHTLVTIALPDGAPVDQALAHTSSAGVPHLRLALHTTLPGAGAIAERPVASSRVSLRISAETAMALANWGIANGHLPRFYDRKLRAEAGGAYRPVFRWWRSRHDRPLVIHLYKLSGGCAYLRVGLDPELEVEGDRLVATFRDRTVEDADGSVALELGVAIANALDLSVDSTRRLASEITVSGGGLELGLRVRAARRVGHDFELEVELRRRSASATLEESTLTRQRLGHEIDEAANPRCLAQIAVQEQP